MRVQLLRVLASADGEVCQCDLQPLCCVAQSTLSHHLRRLADSGLVDVERRGRWAYYTARPERVAEAVAALAA